jgi:hypothetical protein
MCSMDFDDYDDSIYDVEAMRIDHSNGSLGSARSYVKANIIRDSLINGQVKQGRRQIAAWGFAPHEFGLE